MKESLVVGCPSVPGGTGGMEPSALEESTVEHGNVYPIGSTMGPMNGFHAGGWVDRRQDREAGQAVERDGQAGRDSLWGRQPRVPAKLLVTMAGAGGAAMVAFNATGDVVFSAVVGLVGAHVTSRHVG